MANGKQQSRRIVKTQKSANPKNSKAKRKKVTTRSKKAEVRYLSKNKSSVVEIPKRRRKRRTNAQIEADLPQHKCENCDFCQFKNGRHRCIRNKDYPVNIYLNKCKLHSLEVATAIFALPRNDEGVILAS